MALLLAIAIDGAGAGTLTRHVDPFIGTDGTGHVTPAATRPFGMVAPGPDNADHGWSFSSAYQYRAPRILGFSNTHISGAGIPELGDVLLMPSAGRRWDAASSEFSATYPKASEAARPGFYTVRLPAHGVRVELTATARVAVQRYTFVRPGTAQVLVDLQHGLRFVQGQRVTAAQASVDATKGEVQGTVWSKNWVEREASFVLRFSRPIERVLTLPPREGEKAPRYLLDFDLGAGRTLEARIALSTVDVEGARRNLSEAEGRSFGRIRAEADREWNALLGRLRIDARESARTHKLFYSALYRTLLHPSNIADLDGRVRGPRGEVIQMREPRYDSTLSLWDTFRAVHPLFTLVVPERVPGFIDTLVAHHRQMGYLPLWTAWGRETHTMIGNPALPVIADALVKGFTGFDPAAALQAMVETSTRDRPEAPEWAQRGWSVYDEHGYLPFDTAAGESVSKSLEYGIGDAAVARAAKVLGDGVTEGRFRARSKGYVHLFDAQTQTMRGKDRLGRWREPFDPLAPTSPMNNPGDYTEANAWQYTATPALHDAKGFRALLGGPAGLEAWLDRFFRIAMPNPDKHLGQEALIGQYAHANEPSHHIAWLYAFTDAPHKGHALVRRIVADFYGSGPKGIIGNDDCGQMSAWLVFAMLGLYPVQPASGEYVTGVPLLASARLVLSPGRMLHIRRASGGGPRLDGRPMNPSALPHHELVQGTMLILAPR